MKKDRKLVVYFTLSDYEKIKLEASKVHRTVSDYVRLKSTV